MNRYFAFFALLTSLLLAAGHSGTACGAEIISVEPVSEDEFAAARETLGPQQLEDLVGPVALYPDDLLAIVLPASTYPLDIVKAARFLETHASDSKAQPDEAWDESVIALLNYPEVVQLLDSDLDWTWALGEAVLFQEDDLIAAVERFRDRAYEAGNLRSDEHQVVEIDNGAVSIEPVRQEVIYVPYYEPRQVVVYQRVPVYHYYPRAYPVYYYPYPANYRFSSGFFWGVSTAFHISFHSRHLRLHHYSYASHPYFGHHYYPAYYRHHRFHRSAPLYHRAYRASFRSTYNVSAGSRSYGGDNWRGSYRTGVRPREYNDHNYPRRHVAPQSRTATQHATTRASSRHTPTAVTHTANRTTSTTRRQYGNSLASSQSAHDRRDDARDSSRTRSHATRTTTTRPGTANRSAPAREQATRQTHQREIQRSESSREQAQHQARQRTTTQRRDAERESSRQQTQTRTAARNDTQRQPQAATRQTRQRAAAPAESRSQPARSQERQRNAEPRAQDKKRSSASRKSEKRQDDKASRRSR